jgi:hypothetical protein
MRASLVMSIETAWCQHALRGCEPARGTVECLRKCSGNGLEDPAAANCLTPVVVITIGVVWRVAFNR